MKKHFDGPSREGKSGEGMELNGTKKKNVCVGDFFHPTIEILLFFHQINRIHVRNSRKFERVQYNM